MKINISNTRNLRYKLRRVGNLLFLNGRFQKAQLFQEDTIRLGVSKGRNRWHHIIFKTESRKMQDLGRVRARQKADTGGQKMSARMLAAATKLEFECFFDNVQSSLCPTAVATG